MVASSGLQKCNITVDIVDLGIGNISSIRTALLRREIVGRVVSEPRDLHSAIVLLPGVGHFSAGSLALDQSGFRDALLDHTKSGGSLIGICLGMQLLGNKSEEGQGLGLGVINFSSERVAKLGLMTEPLMGWKQPVLLRESWLGLSGSERYFFSHDFGLSDTKSSFARMYHSHGNLQVVSAVEQGNVIGFQFHPERSHSFGQEILLSAIRKLWT